MAIIDIHFVFPLIAFPQAYPAPGKEHVDTDKETEQDIPNPEEEIAKLKVQLERLTKEKHDLEEKLAKKEAPTQETKGGFFTKMWSGNP